MRKTSAALALLSLMSLVSFASVTLLGAPDAMAQKGAGTSTDAPKNAPLTAGKTTDKTTDALVPAASPNAVGVGLNGEKIETDKDKKKDDGTAEPKASEGKGDDFDVEEKPGKTYYFIGLRYGLTIIPKFMLNIFVSEGASFTSNTIGAEIDIRKDGFSLIPSISYAEYGKGEDVLFLQKNADPNVDGNWSYVHSSLKALYLGADLLWSAKISKNVDFEYGVGFGLGFIFGDLVNNWVYTDQNGPLTSSDGSHHFSPCATENQGAATSNGCQKAGHQNATVAKVGSYTEPSWANGGSKPNIFPRILLHIAGVRVKPMKQVEARLGLGFSLTEGFWFGLSGNFGLEKVLEKKSTAATGNGPSLQF